nr:unnamed protein product [Callosobruchus chinensis]
MYPGSLRLPQTMEFQV